jgi:hypothetical protein
MLKRYAGLMALTVLLGLGTATVSAWDHSGTAWKLFAEDDNKDEKSDKGGK